MLTLVYACDEKGAIGYQNQLPWPHMRPDMQRFIAATKGKVVIMGRKTWESLPVGSSGTRALPNRLNVVITRQEGYQADGAQVYNSLSAALEAFKEQSTCVIGGAELYLQTLGLADEIFETRIQQQYEADVYLPRIDYGAWDLVDQVQRPADQLAPTLFFNHYLRPPDWLAEAQGGE